MHPPFLIDTHTHIYLPEFDADRDEMIGKALKSGVDIMLLPNIDAGSIARMNNMANLYPNHCFPMMGLHPTSVKEDYRKLLETVKTQLASGAYYGIGETGIDLHWDTTYLEQQCIAFEEQIRLSLAYKLPVIVHARKSFEPIFEVLEGFKNKGLKGVFHAFTGDAGIAEKAISFGFKLGIGGILTFKNSGLDKTIHTIGIDHLVLETDSPYLAPVPMRGKRNESSYLYYIAEALGSILGMETESVAAATTSNALHLFNTLPHAKES